MKKKIRKTLIGFLGGTLFTGYMALASPAFADNYVEEKVTPQKAMSIDHKKEKKSADSNEIFAKDRISLQIASGYLSLNHGIGPTAPDFNYSLLHLRGGWMINNPTESYLLPKNNLELLGVISAASIHEEFGSYFCGIALLVRWNVLLGKWNPYFQAGAGVIYTDAYKYSDQGVIGQAIEFTPQASIGLRHIINKNWSVGVEFMGHHISNAGLAKKNGGTNAVGGLAGFTYHFDEPWNFFNWLSSKIF